MELCIKNKLLLDSVDAWLLTQRTLVNARKKCLLPVVRERQQLADSLAKYLSLLGLKRVARDADIPPWEKSGNSDGEAQDGKSDEEGKQ